MFSGIFISFIIFNLLPTYISTGQNATERVLNSWDADDWRYSHLIAIMNRYAARDYLHCGGSLLTTSIVLTACHCLLKRTDDFFETYLLYAMAGVHHLLAEKGKQVRDFREENGFVVHRECNSSNSFQSDVGLGFLVKPFELTKTVRLVRFISTDDQIVWYWLKQFGKRRKICHIVGWGRTDNTIPETSQQLRDGRVRLISEHDCRRDLCYVYGECPSSEKKTKKICTIPYENSTGCKGDSGGPLMCNEYIFGVVSGGSGECQISKRVPSFYCDPLTVLEFIRYYVPDYKGTRFPARQDPPSLVAPFKYPFVVSIANVTNEYIPRSICAGSILTKSSVITTCECVLEVKDTFSATTQSYENVAVISGITNLFEDSLYKQQLKITRLEVGCDSATEGVGVGIVFVNDEFPFATRRVQPLRMLTDDAVIVRKLIKTLKRSGKKCSMATWGYVDEEPTEIRYNVFKEWQVRLHHPRACTRRPFCLAHPKLCSYLVHNSEPLCGETHESGDLCSGDSGGPLICEGYFMGVVTFNGELCDGNNHVIITSLLGIHDFVKRVIPDYNYHYRWHPSKGCFIRMPFFQLLLLFPMIPILVFLKS